MKETIEGIVAELEDCGHLSVMDNRGYDILQRILKEMKNKKVTITILEEEEDHI